jgi:beta-glucosidase
MSRIDDAVKRILVLKYKLGLFDNPYPEKEAVANFGKAEYQSLALDAAHEAMTLLKNENQYFTYFKISKSIGSRSGSTKYQCIKWLLELYLAGEG